MTRLPIIKPPAIHSKRDHVGSCLWRGVPQQKCGHIEGGPWLQEDVHIHVA